MDTILPFDFLVVILTYYPVVEDDYSADHVICAALVDREWKKKSFLNVENDHIFLFLSVGWIRTYLKKHSSVSFQRTVKGVDRLEEHSIFPYSIKYELAKTGDIICFFMCSDRIAPDNFLTAAAVFASVANFSRWQLANSYLMLYGKIECSSNLSTPLTVL